MFISIGHVSRLAGVSKSILRRWERDDYLLPEYRTNGNHRRALYRRIMNFLGLSKDKSEKELFIYLRVSSARQKDDLKRQITSLENYAKPTNCKINGVHKDIASGLNDERKNLLKLITDIPPQNCRIIFCAPTGTVARAL